VRSLLRPLYAPLKPVADRNNAAAARLRGFQTDLSMNDTQFATVLSILYVGVRACLPSDRHD
jgi:hypothetical protein